MDKILVLDFGGQYDLLIARRVREHHVYAEIVRYNGTDCESIISKGYKGIIFTGGPNSVYDEKSPHFDKRILELGIPVLGICYGDQLIAYMEGGKIESAENSSEYGNTDIRYGDSVLFKGLPKSAVCFMSHTDYISELPEGFVSIAHTDKCENAAMCDEKRKIFGVQFHPEVTHTQYGQKIVENFLFSVCNVSADWMMDDFIDSTVSYYKEKLKGKKVLLALSGGVDSSVLAVLLNRAVKDDLVCVFVDHGLLRKDEGDFVERTFGEKFGLNLIRINAKDRFLKRLEGVKEPERKRKIIGEEFIRVFEEKADELSDIEILAQGTIYPDVVESGKGDSAVIKSHHNVGGLPQNMRFTKIIEPLRDLFKDEVREVGEKLGIPKELVYRPPFPGPGLAVRIIGEITDEKLDMLKEADSIFREEIDKSLTDRPQQYFAVLTDTNAVGVMGDMRTYGYTLALRAVDTADFMTAQWTRLPYEILAKASNRITNEVKGITRVVYDITSKPPGTVEWE